MYDLLIKNGRVVDGSGMPWFHGDVAVKDGRIAETGKLSGPAQRVIDADGHVIAPGFIDNHCHYDAQVTWDPLCSFSCYHGATTVVIGNCSLALAPVHEGDEYFLSQVLARVEAIPIEVLEGGVEWSWRSIPQYLDALDRRLGVNVASLIGHSAVRRYVMGDASYERAATGDEIEQMQAIVREAMDAGAIGLSVNRQSHLDLAGRPIPSCVATQEEMLALASVLGDVGTGVVQCGGGAVPEIQEGLCSRLAEISGRPVIYNSIRHHPSDPSLWRTHLDRVESSAQRGLRAYPLVRSRDSAGRFNMRNAQHFDRLSNWKKVMKGTKEEKLAAFQDPAIREGLRSDVNEAADRPRPNFSRRWDDVLVHKVALPRNAKYEGKSIEQAANEQGKDKLDAFLDLVVEEDLGTIFERYLPEDDEAVVTLLRSPYTIVGISDGGAHIAYHANYDFGTYFLGHWVRERKIMSLEDGVRKLTFDTASLLGMHDRGLLRPGMAADVVVFDPDTIGPQPVGQANDLPTGASRLSQLANGIDYTVVNGEVLIDHGDHTGAYPGRVVRNNRWRMETAAGVASSR